MKKSRRYFLNTLFTVAVALVVMVAANRFYAPAASAYMPERTPPADLAALRGFTAILADGDFALEVHEQSDFAVSYAAVSEKHGEFTASLDGYTLVLNGYGNHSHPGGEIAIVRVGLPALQQLHVNGLSGLSVSDISKQTAELQINNIKTIRFLRNSAPLQVSSNGVLEVELDKSSAANTTLHILGYTTVKHIQE